MIVYIVTNLVNDKKYIGIDSKNNPKYFGSGHFIKQAIKKYGINNFKKDILEECKTREELLECEKKWIKFYDAVNDDRFYNIHEGGMGGDITIYMTDDDIIKWKSNISNTKKGQRLGIPLSDKNKEGISKSLLDFYSNNPSPNIGKKHSDETKEKISNSHIGKKLSDDHKDSIKEGIKTKRRSYDNKNNPFYGKGDLISGDKNPMYGKSFYDVWVSKYGKEEADRKFEEWKNKRRKK